MKNLDRLKGSISISIDTLDHSESSWDSVNKLKHTNWRRTNINNEEEEKQEEEEEKESQLVFI